MHISIVLVSAILVISVFAPFFLFNAVGKGEMKKIKAQSKAAVTKHNLKVTQEETWGSTYIGIDAVQKKLLFLKVAEAEVYERIFDLNNIKGCRILEQRKVFKPKEHRDSILEKLDLEVTINSTESVALNFYDAEQKYKENFEHLRAEKWKAIVLGQLSSTVVGRKVA